MKLKTAENPTKLLGIYSSSVMLYTFYLYLKISPYLYNFKSYNPESRLEIEIESKCKPWTAKPTTKPCPYMPHLHIFCIPPGMATQLRTAQTTYLSCNMSASLGESCGGRCQKPWRSPGRQCQLLALHWPSVLLCHRR